MYTRIYEIIEKLPAFLFAKERFVKNRKWVSRGTKSERGLYLHHFYPSDNLRATEKWGWERQQPPIVAGTIPRRGRREGCCEHLRTEVHVQTQKRNTGPAKGNRISAAAAAAAAAFCTRLSLRMGVDNGRKPFEKSFLTDGSVHSRTRGGRIRERKHFYLGGGGGNFVAGCDLYTRIVDDERLDWILRSMIVPSSMTRIRKYIDMRGANGTF